MHYPRLIMSVLLLTVLFMNEMVGNANVLFKFSANSIEDGVLKSRMENNISALLTEINRAGSNGSSLNLSEISMEQEAKERLITLWDDSRFVCDKPINISACRRDFQGYQVRAVPITMKPQNSSYNQSLNRELTVSLDKNGMITGVRPAWELNEDVNKILVTTGTGGIMETWQRWEILKLVEDLSSYYSERNLDAIEKFLSDDGLILKGSEIVVVRQLIDTLIYVPTQKVRYRKSDKSNYLRNLRTLFATAKKLNIEFANISVMKHGAKPNIFGLSILQKFNSAEFKDEIWLFLLLDFNDSECVKIYKSDRKFDDEINEGGVYYLGEDGGFIP